MICLKGMFPLWVHSHKLFLFISFLFPAKFKYFLGKLWLSLKTIFPFLYHITLLNSKAIVTPHMGQTKPKHKKHEWIEQMLKSLLYFSLNLCGKATPLVSWNLICFHVFVKEMNQAHYYTWLWTKQWLHIIVEYALR